MKRILIVDDEENIGRSLRLILEREGYAVSICGSAAEFQSNPDVRRADAFLLDVRLPDTGFYLWARIPPALHGGDDIAFALGLLAQYNVTVLPGSLLARQAHGVNPGAGRIRLALVADGAECVEAAERIVAYIKDHR